MKLNTALNIDKAQTSSIEISDFKIKNSAAAFAVLSSSIYSNKIRAIIRELSCNAYDSHVAAGKKDVPFDIHLPSAFECWFSIRDYGVGLSQDEVEMIYTTYFESTKTESNDFIGAFGLGSKTPFCYTDNFTISAYQDGFLNIYTAFVGDNGCPAIAKMSSTETDQPNGLEVKFGCQNGDIYKFVEEAQVALEFFEVKPNISGAHKLTFTVTEYDQVFNPPSPLIAGVRKNNKTYSTRHNRAIVGNVAYPITTVIDGFETIHDSSLDMVFSVGQLDIQASREGISFTKTTTQTIKRRYEDIVEKFDSELESKISNTNLWESLHMLVEMARGNTFFSKLATIKIANHPLIVKNIVYKSGSHISFRDSHIRDILEQCNLTLSNESRPDLHVWNGFIVIDDGIRSLSKRINQYCDTHPSRISYEKVILTPLHDNRPINVDKFLKLMYDLDKSKLVFNADLPPAIVKPRASKIEATYKTLSKVRRGWRDVIVWSTTTKKVDIAKSTDKFMYAVLTPSFNVTAGDVEYNPKRIYEILAAPNSAYSKYKNIVYIGKETYEKIKDDPNWTHGYPLLMTEVKAKISPKEIFSYVCSSSDFNKWTELAPYIDPNSDFYQCIQPSKISAEDLQLHNIFFKKDFEKDYTTEISAAKQKLDQAKAKYPLIDFINSPRYYQKMGSSVDVKFLKNIAEYINLIDKKGNQV